ncbi:MAG: hypothetical protein MJB14_16835, partial [Spirochaetes bacterium]|nr:hypothetical protein [Spirochaetota bacterium]
MESLTKLLNNGNALDLNSTKYYASILGESPSKGARSPKLWNRAFSKLNIDAIMHPMDVKSSNLENVVKELKKDQNFIGGAITMPYKIDIIPYLDKTEPLAEKTGAVNCIYRKKGQLIGTNTDGAGAIWSIEQHYLKSLKNKTVLLLGTGGAGFAVATYIASAIGKLGNLLIAN